MRTPIATPNNAVIALLLAAACATPRVTPRPAHASFDPLQSKATTNRALEAVKARGYELAFHDAARGLILTRTREGQVACGLNECLARDTLILRLDAGRAVAVLSRQLFDPSLRYWEAPRQPADLDAVEADEVALLQAFLAEPPTLRLSREGEPCAGKENCERGLACESRRCRAAGASTPPARLPAPGEKRLQ
ncbi:MAG TPA: hypothetical protein VLT61_01340 [Anaeromyxobacteraceae bacterium]|nr:hypothetical protein [Anaeromyxobacteraceae bacterium]